MDPDLTGEETTAAPVDQAPLDWTENIDWTIKKTKSVRSKFSKILQSEDYITRSKWMDARFQKELDAVKSLRARKQMAYAKKALGRRPMSKQANFNRQHGGFDGGLVLFCASAVAFVLVASPPGCGGGVRAFGGGADIGVVRR